MSEDWRQLVILHGNEAGARAAFEAACLDLLSALHPDKAVRGIRPNRGDGGIDVYVGELGQSPVDVYQCKFFIHGINHSQRGQIRASYQTATTLPDINVAQWFLCLPVEMDRDETLWFNNWAADKRPKPQVVPPSTLSSWARDTGLDAVIFKRHDSSKLDRIIMMLAESGTDPWSALVARTERDCLAILQTLVRMHFNALPDKPVHLADLADKTGRGDRIAACGYVTGVLAGGLPDAEKVWLFTMLNDFSFEPIAFKFIRRYDNLVAKADELGHKADLSTSGFYSVWSSLRSPAAAPLRQAASWTVSFP